MASPAKAILLRVPRNDSPDPDQYVLLHIIRTSLTQPLDMQLHATEGERAFGMKLKQSKIDDLRAKSYLGSAEELERILSTLLLKITISEPFLVPRGVELAASVDNDCVTLTIRQDVGGIKQRIAAIKIPEAEVDIPIFEWAVESCGTIDSNSSEIQTLQARVSSQEEEIAELADQFKLLVALKKEHEETLLAKFSELLNSKKRKIRELNQALEKADQSAATSGAPEPTPEVEIREETPPLAGPSKARATRAKAAPKATARKRKPTASLSDSESDGFVKMDIDSKGKSVAAPTAGDDTEDTEDSEGAGKSRDYLRQNELGHSDRSASEDELPPVRRPFEAFTLMPPEKRVPEPETQTQGVEEDSEPKAAVRGRGRGGRARGGRGGGKGKGKEPASPPPPPEPARGRMATRSKPSAKKPSPSPSPPPADNSGETGEDTDDDEL